MEKFEKKIEVSKSINEKALDAIKDMVKNGLKSVVLPGYDAAEVVFELQTDQLPIVVVDLPEDLSAETGKKKAYIVSVKK